jgi:hypothetical protein
MTVGNNYRFASIMGFEELPAKRSRDDSRERVLAANLISPLWQKAERVAELFQICLDQKNPRFPLGPAFFSSVGELQQIKDELRRVSVMLQNQPSQSYLILQNQERFRTMDITLMRMEQAVPFFLAHM